jgi:hypothetical protein
MATNKLIVVTGFGLHDPSGRTRAYLNVSQEEAVRRFKDFYETRDKPQVDIIEFDDELALDVGRTNQVIIST